MVIHGLVAMVLDEFVALGGFQIFPHHFGNEFVEGGSRRPAQLFPGFAGVAEQGFHFCRAEVAGIDGNDALAVTVVALLIHAVAIPSGLPCPALGRRH